MSDVDAACEGEGETESEGEGEGEGEGRARAAAEAALGTFDGCVVGAVDAPENVRVRREFETVLSRVMVEAVSYTRQR